LRRSSREIDPLAAMRAANPADAAELRRSLTAADLGEALRRAVALGHRPAGPIQPGDRAAGELGGARPRRRGGGFARRRLVLGLGGGLAIAALAVAIVLLSGGSVRGGRPAFAEAAIEVAEANPRLLVGAPGWKVTRADEFEADEGEVTFGDGSHELAIHWYPARLYRGYLHDRASVSPQRRSRLLGRLATTVHYGGREYATMLAPQGSVFLEVRGGLGSRGEYERVLHSLRPASVEEWLGAMPPSVVRPGARAQAIAGLLHGVPLPPNFDLARLQGKDVIRDHRALGVEVGGGVACGWVQAWQAARRAGDAAGAREAVAAMATVPSWPMVGDPRVRTPWAGNLKRIAGELAHGRLDRGAAGEVVNEDGSGYALGPAWAVAFNCTDLYWRHPLPR